MTDPDAARVRRFDELFASYLPVITAYCRWRSPSAADAEDAIAEVFLTCWRRLESVPAGSGAWAWLYAAARRVTANQRRAARRRQSLTERLRSLPSPPPMQPFPSPESSADLVRAALAELGPRDQEVLLLAVWEGLTPIEIATVLGCAAVTARGRLHRARRRFRAVYERLGTESVLPLNPERSLCDVSR